MLINQFSSKFGQAIYQEEVNGQSLQIRQHEHYQWYHHGGEAIQSLLDFNAPEKVLSPVNQSMLLFLLWQDETFNILNLGLGGGAFERYLHHLNQSTGYNVNLTTVEKYSEIISLAKQHFNLPQNSNIIQQCAAQYLAGNREQHNILLCDIFANQDVPNLLFKDSFYQSLANNTVGSVLINLNITDKNQFIELLLTSRRYFTNIALIQCPDFTNIILVLSHQPIPDKTKLLSQNIKLHQSLGMDFTNIINNLTYIPQQ